MNIFIVDDSEDSRDITEAALFTAGYRDISSAGSAKQLFTELRLDRPDAPAVAVDLMLVDIVMPEVDGIEACARIRNDTRYVDIPIIMVTSLADMDSLANAFVAGATDYITKPINRIELLARVRAALKLKAELERRLARERELLEFLSTWGDRRASLWIDETTGLLVGEVAEAYLTAVTDYHAEEASIVALKVDRLNGAESAKRILGQVALIVQQTTATVGVIAAAYRNGVIVLIAPEVGADAALGLAETLQADIAALGIPHCEPGAAAHVTASIAVTSGRVRSGADRAQLLTRAIATAQNAAANGGNRIVPVAV
jgi:PleD family two-component response regulator